MINNQFYLILHDVLFHPVDIFISSCDKTLAISIFLGYRIFLLII